MAALASPIVAIPAYYIFSLTPHIYAMTLLKSSGFKANNANPKASASPAAVQGKVPAAVFEKYQRAESAQANNHENMALFAAAVLSSVVAERVGKGAAGEDPTGLRTFVGAWFAVRAAYTVAYVQIGSHKASFVRTACWAVGTGLAAWQFVKAARVLG